MTPAILARLSARDRRALVFGAATMATLAFATRTVPSLVKECSRRAASARELAGASRRAEASVRDLARLRDSLVRRSARLAQLDSAFLVGQTQASVGASLATLVGEAATLSETELGQAQISVDSADHGFRKVTMRVQTAGDIESMALFLESLEQGPALLHVTELSLAAADAANPVASDLLRGDVVVEGIARARSSTASHP